MFWNLTFCVCTYFYDIVFAVIFAFGCFVSTLVLGAPVTRGPREESIQGAECGCRAEGRRLVEEARSLTPDCHPSVICIIGYLYYLPLLTNLNRWELRFNFLSRAAQLWPQTWRLNIFYNNPQRKGILEFCLRQKLYWSLRLNAYHKRDPYINGRR